MANASPRKLNHYKIFCVYGLLVCSCAQVFIGENLVPFLGFEEGLSDLVLTSAQLGEDSKVSD